MTRSDQKTPFELSGDEFRRLGNQLVERLATYLDDIHRLPVAPPNEPVTKTRDLLGDRALPTTGAPADRVLEQVMDLVLSHSVLTAHPRFWAYITGSAAPLGALGDLLAAAVNPNVASWNTAGAASAFEAQAIRWIAELVGFDPKCGGLVTSGGTAANLLPFIAALRKRADWDVRATGVHPGDRPHPRIYATREAHPWVIRATDVCGLGSNAIHWIEADEHLRMRPAALRAAIQADRAAGAMPFMAVGTCGTVSLGTVDPLPAIADICEAEDVWFHVDGAYGAVAACSPEAPAEMKALARADSIACDPHKWLYIPLEAGCCLMKDSKLLAETFTYATSFFQYGSGLSSDLPPPWREQGLQNSRAFKALKIWMCLSHAGRDGYVESISRNIKLARELHDVAERTAGLEALSTALSTTVFRYVPPDLDADQRPYLDKLNAEILRRMQAEGVVYPSGVACRGVHGLRVCIVNFRTTWADLETLLAQTIALGREVDAALPTALTRATDAGAQLASAARTIS